MRYLNRLNLFKKSKPIKSGKITFILSEDHAVRPTTHIRYHITAILAAHWDQFVAQYKRWIGQKNRAAGILES